FMVVVARNRGRGSMKNRRAAAKYPRLLRRQQASQYLLEVHGLQFAPSTLAKFACQGTGPEIRFVNSIPFYPPPELDTWARATISKPNVPVNTPSLEAAADRLSPYRLPLPEGAACQISNPNWTLKSSSCAASRCRSKATSGAHLSAMLPAILK